MHPLVRLDPLSIQVKASEVSPEVAVYNSIRVDHRYDNHLEVLEEFLIGKQVLQETFEDK